MSEAPKAEQESFESLIIDGDWLLFSVTSICDRKYIEVRDSLESTPIEYKNITTFRGTLDKEFRKTVRDDYIIEDKVVLKDKMHLGSCIHILGSKIQGYLSTAKAKKIVIAVAGSSNFRDRIPLPKKYKGERDNSKPLLYQELKNYVLNNYECLVAEDEEADDILSKNQYQHKDCGTSLSCTIDKDNKSIPGYLLNPNNDHVSYVEGLGGFGLKTSGSKQKLYGYGRCWEYIQWVIGDSVDNYHPLDLLSKKCIQNNQSNYTKVTTKPSDHIVYEEVKDFTTDKEWLQYIHDKYYSWYSNLKWYKTWDDKLIKDVDYIDILQLYVDCAHMRRWDDDKVDIRQVLKNQEII